ncbi:MAG: YggS family pyridoxal phosphate-dependent enzyme [Candidatus Aminicenantes bacterium]|nr:MAG: YggS family pyridoxal phosphate-dependent enzyme [Candidatus Aminicenantes bacterium]
MIEENVKRILEELPPGVQLVAAAKTRTPEEILQAAEAGILIIGQNYVQEALAAFNLIGHRVKWHFIGHLQRNKAKKAIEIFDMIETLDSVELAREIDKRSNNRDKIISVLIEVNSGREKQKFGIFPEEVESFLQEISGFKNIKIQGLMTMGPMFGDPENARPYFVETKKVFERIKSLDLPDVEMKYLSMGMTNSYRVAIEEGANIVRIGTKIFGPREYD